MKDTIAAVDLGSNSFHLTVARRTVDGFRIVDKLREPVRLGAGLGSDKRLDEASIERALCCLENFGHRLKGLDSGSVSAVGTNVFREAINVSALLDRAVPVLGHPIRVVSGKEEARLIYSGVSHELDDEKARSLVVDIGGGSTEIIVGTGRKADVLESLNMGCVSFSDRFFPERRVTVDALRAAENEVGRLMQEVVPAFKAIGWEQVHGASGTLQKLGDLCERLGGSSEGVTPESLRAIEHRLLELKDFDRFVELGLSPDRAEVLAAGLCIMKGIVASISIERVSISNAAVREGLLLELLSR